MSPISGSLTPEARATWDAVMAKLAAPGKCNPDDPHPTVDGEAGEEAVKADHRSVAQRQHDGLNAALRALLASGELGRHQGLPVSIVVTTTLDDLQAASEAANTARTASAKARTGGGTWVPMSDVIRMAAQAYHYLAIFQKHTNVPLYLAKTRLATPGQRLVLYALDGGCTRPGCTVCAYDCQAHHLTPHAQTGRTDIHDLTLACPSDHPRADEGWTTRKNHHGITEWIPPPHLDTEKPRTNNYFHPQRYHQQRKEEEDEEAN
jgi:hypothetical protein